MRSFAVVSCLALLVPLVPRAAEAQDDPDFLFGQPRGAITVRAGFRSPSASGDIYDFFAETLTLGGGDFRSLVVGLDVALAIHPRIDVLAGLEFSKPRPTSEYRDFVEDDGAAITQRTELSTVPLTASLKLYLAPRGRAVSRFAFVPSKLRPYVGGGAGLVRYNLIQSGDFVDFLDLSIFTSMFQSSGWTSQAHVFGGVDVQLAPRYHLALEARYAWANATLGGDFVGFEPIDLNSFQTTAGIRVSF